MRNLLVFIIFILSWNILIAQTPCDDDVIMNVKGRWKKHNDANMKADKNQAEIINRLEVVGQFISEIKT